MTKQPSTTEFATEAGISMGYASDLLRDNRPMPRSLAIHMFKRTGWKHHSIASLTTQQIKILAQVESWTPPKERAAA